MIHLIVRLPLPYQQVLCQTLSDAYNGAFVAWFAERKDDEFPYRSMGEHRFSHHYLSEVGYGKLFKVLQADPDAVVILGGWSSPMTNKTLLVTTLLRIPVFVWADHPHPRKRPWVLAQARNLYLRCLSRLVSGFLACGSPTVEHLASMGIEPSKITNFPYWVELPPAWAVPQRCIDDERAARPLRLLAIGRLVSVKQFEVAIKAVALANKRAGYQVAELVVAGDGPERAHLEVLAQALSSDCSVRFAGWLEPGQVAAELERSDVLVVTSSFEPYGVVVLEAMAVGRPVLASDRLMAAIDRDEGTGAVLLHPSADVECLASQIELLGSSRAKLQQASLAARSTAEKWPPERAVFILAETIAMHKRRSQRSIAGSPALSVDSATGKSTSAAASESGTH